MSTHHRPIHHRQNEQQPQAADGARGDFLCDRRAAPHQPRAAIKAKLRQVQPTADQLHRTALSSQRTTARPTRLLTAALCSADEVKRRPTARLYIIRPQSLNKADGPRRDEEKKEKNGGSRRATTSSGAHPGGPRSLTSFTLNFQQLAAALIRAVNLGRLVNERSRLHVRLNAGRLQPSRPTGSLLWFFVAFRRFTAADAD